MGIHKGLEFIFLFKLFGGRETLLLLLLVKHHLLDDAASLAVQVGQLGVFGFNLLRVNLRVTLKHAIPPVLALLLRQHQLQHALSILVALNRPQRVVHLNRF